MLLERDIVQLPGMISWDINKLKARVERLGQTRTSLKGSR